MPTNDGRGARFTPGDVIVGAEVAKPRSAGEVVWLLVLEECDKSAPAPIA